MFNVERFIKAQDSWNSYVTALKEINEGCKRSHWIWYVFPQIEGLGRSEMSRRYSIGSLLEAKAYLDNPYLKGRLYEAAKAALGAHDRYGYSMDEIFGELDARKVLSCMTLFNYVEPDSIYQNVIHYCFEDLQCQFTRKKIDPQYEWIRTSAFTRNELYIDEKAMFESGSYESEQYSFEQRLATLVDLYMKGERMDQMVQHYLWSRDCLSYRTSGVESTVTNFIAMFIHYLFEKTDDAAGHQALAMYQRRLDNVDEVLQAACEFDIIFYELTKNENWMPLIDRYVEQSLLRFA